MICAREEQRTAARFNRQLTRFAPAITYGDDDDFRTRLGFLSWRISFIIIERLSPGHIDSIASLGERDARRQEKIREQNYITASGLQTPRRLTSDDTRC